MAYRFSGEDDVRLYCLHIFFSYLLVLGADGEISGREIEASLFSVFLSSSRKSGSACLLLSTSFLVN